MCELEKHVMMLRENGGPLSPSRILSHMRSINCQIGDGSQEDAHEFLRSLKNHLIIYLYENVLFYSDFVEFDHGKKHLIIRMNLQCLSIRKKKKKKNELVKSVKQQK